MKIFEATFQSPRTFEIWDYQISHGQLLIRSPKNTKASSQPFQMNNIDLVFLDVNYMFLPDRLEGLEITTPNDSEISSVNSFLEQSVPTKHFHILKSGNKRFCVVSFFIQITENNWDIYDSPFEFRSRQA